MRPRLRNAEELASCQQASGNRNRQTETTQGISRGKWDFENIILRDRIMVVCFFNDNLKGVGTKEKDKESSKLN